MEMRQRLSAAFHLTLSIFKLEHDRMHHSLMRLSTDQYGISGWHKRLEQLQLTIGLRVGEYDRQQFDDFFGEKPRRPDQHEESSEESGFEAVRESSVQVKDERISLPYERARKLDAPTRKTKSRATRKELTLPEISLLVSLSQRLSQQNKLPENRVTGYENGCVGCRLNICSCAGCTEKVQKFIGNVWSELPSKSRQQVGELKNCTFRPQTNAVHSLKTAGNLSVSKGLNRYVNKNVFQRLSESGQLSFEREYNAQIDGSEPAGTLRGVHEDPGRVPTSRQTGGDTQRKPVCVADSGLSRRYISPKRVSKSVSPKSILEMLLSEGEDKGV